MLKGKFQLLMVRGWRDIVGNPYSEGRIQKDEINMKLIVEPIKKLLEFPAIWIGILYLYWLMFVPVDEAFILGIILFVIYLIVTILEKLSNRNWKFSLVLLVVLLPVTWEAGRLTFWLLTGWLDREFIFIVLLILLAGYPIFSVLQRPPGRNKTLSILLFVAILPTLALNVIYFISYFPEVIDRVEFGNSKYYIASELNMDYHSYLTFYKCKKWSPICTSLYSTYDRQDFDKIIIDQEKGEVSAISSEPDSRLVYTDGETPRLYEGYPVQLDDHIYQVSTYNTTCKAFSCTTYIYTLYECKLSYLSCNALPIQYSQNYDISIVLDANPTANEINAYDNHDDTLIFTFGKHSQCYVDGCVILKEK